MLLSILSRTLPAAPTRPALISYTRSKAALTVAPFRILNPQNINFPSTEDWFYSNHLLGLPLYLDKIIHTNFPERVRIAIQNTL